MWNSVISSFQCEINGGITIAPNVGVILIGQNNVKINGFWGLSMSKEKPSRSYSCDISTWT